MLSTLFFHSNCSQNKRKLKSKKQNNINLLKNFLNVYYIHLFLGVLVKVVFFSCLNIFPFYFNEIIAVISEVKKQVEILVYSNINFYWSFPPKFSSIKNLKFFTSIARAKILRRALFHVWSHHHFHIRFQSKLPAHLQSFQLMNNI